MDSYHQPLLTPSLYRWTPLSRVKNNSHFPSIYQKSVYCLIFLLTIINSFIFVFPISYYFLFYSSCSFLTFFILSFVGVCTAAPSATAAAFTHLDEQRLCAELTASGLGGGACGTPSASVEGDHRWRRQYQEQRQLNGSDGDVATPRQDACPVLCDNGLGRPLCECNQLGGDVVSGF